MSTAVSPSFDRLPPRGYDQMTTAMPTYLASSAISRIWPIMSKATSEPG